MVSSDTMSSARRVTSAASIGQYSSLSFVKMFCEGNQALTSSVVKSLSGALLTPVAHGIV